MFGKTRVSQSMLDAVNSVIGEEPVVENKKPKAMLSEEIVDFNIDPLTGKMIEVKDYLVSGYERPVGKKQIVMIEEEPTITPETLKGQILKKKDNKKASLGKSAIAMSAEETELDEEGNCVTPMKAKKIADKEVGKHEKEMHKESMTFKERLLEKSTSEKQARTMAAAAHNPKFAKKVGIPQSVAKDFNQADKGTKQLSNAMKKEEIELDEKDELRDRIGTNIVNKKPREGQTDLRNIPVGNRPDSKKNFSQGERDSQPTRLKNSIKASLGKHTKPNLPEEMEVTESLKDVAKKILSKVGHPDDKGMRKDLQKKVGVPQTGEKPKNEEVELDEGTMTHITLGKKVKNKEGGHNQDVHHKGKKIGLISSYSHRTGTRYGMHHDATGDMTAGSRSAEDAIADLRQAHAEHLQDTKVKKEEVESVDENAFTDYKTDKKPSIFAPKKHTAKKTSTGTMYTKNWSKKDMEHKDDDKMKKEAVDKEAEKHVRVDGETDMKTKTVDGLRGRMKVSADFHNKSKSYKVAMPVGEETEHDDEAEDKALVKKMVKKDALKKTDEAFKGPEAGSGVGDHPFVTSEAKPLKNARELAKNTMGRLKKEMLGKISN
jgi:hypothetical protein